MIPIVMNSKIPTALNARGFSTHPPSDLFQVLFILKLAIHFLNIGYTFLCSLVLKVSNVSSAIAYIRKLKRSALACPTGIFADQL